MKKPPNDPDPVTDTPIWVRIGDLWHGLEGWLQGIILLGLVGFLLSLIFRAIERPVLGWGLNNFDDLYLSLERPGRGFLGEGAVDVPDTAHNLYLNTLVEQAVSLTMPAVGVLTALVAGVPASGGSGVPVCDPEPVPDWPPGAGTRAPLSLPHWFVMYELFVNVTIAGALAQCASLALPAMSYCTGAVVVVDGGFTTKNN